MIDPVHEARLRAGARYGFKIHGFRTVEQFGRFNEDEVDIITDELCKLIELKANGSSVIVAARQPTATDLHRDATRRAGEGKAAKAPCGHPGEHVIGSWIRCLYGCDGEAAAPQYIRPEKTGCLHTGKIGEIQYRGKHYEFCAQCGEECEKPK